MKKGGIIMEKTKNFRSSNKDFLNENVKISIENK